MEFYEIKFSFNHKLMDKKSLDTVFSNIGDLFDVRFDENLNFYRQKNDGEIYELKEVSDETIEKQMNIFFKFTFTDIIDVPLYKFLVLRCNDELTILANIHSSIFDYSSVNVIKEIFNNPEASHIPKDIGPYFEEYDAYLNSPDFKNDSSYWQNKLFGAENYVKYFNIKSNNYRNIGFSIENDSILTFLKNHKISRYDFFTAIFSLYLSRTDSTEGCLLKSSINADEVVFGSHVKNTLLVIDYYKNDTFEEYLNRIQKDYKEAIEHTKVRIEDYIDSSFYYAIHDFTNLNDIDVRNGDGSALTFNVYKDSIDIIYNYEVFSDIYIRYLIENIKHLTDNVLEGINQRCGDLEFLSIGEKYDFNGLYELTDSQMTIYRDSQNGTGTRYNNPLKLGLGNSYPIAKIKKAISKLLKLHPVLTSRIIEECLMGFDAKPPVVVGSAEDIETFVQPFELNNYLSRFLIVENKNDVFLCMDFHSLIFDATSFNTAINSLLKILNGENTELVDTGFLREISFEETINNSEYRDYAQKFYDSALSERDEVNDLIFSVAEDSSKSYVERFSIDDESLTSFLDYHNITHNQFFTSVFAYTLSRFTGYSKVLFNLITDGRAHLGLSDSVGMFFQTSPVLMECDNQSVESFMNYSSDIIDTVSKFDLYSYLDVVFDYQLENTVSFGVLQDIFSSTLDIEFEMMEKDMWANFSVVVYYAKENSLEIRIFYSEKYSDNFVKHFANSFKLILEGIVTEEMLSDINYIDESDLKLLDSYNKTEYPLMFDDILEAFNFNLFKDLGRPLVSYKDKVYDYGQGAFIADKLACTLKDAGVSEGDNVAFLVERSELYMFCILGVLSTGARYVPLDDAHPDEHIKFILNDTSAKTVIVSDETYNRVKYLNGDTFIINISDIVNGEIEELASLPTVKSDIACILYTSGSTGLPKGVKITRKAILNSVESYVHKYNMTNEDVYGLFATIGFNTASLGICISFYSGACLSVVPGDIKLDMVKLNDYFIEHGVTHTLITTQVGKLYMETIDESPLRIITVIGEKLGEFDNPNDYHFVDSFGLTEVFSSITSLYNTKKIDSSSIGMWNFNTKMYILDAELRRVPVGAVGELCISGYQISDGYLNREKESSKAFVNNPFNDSKDYGVMFRTGDMVRILPDGALGIIGRRDTQVKIRGNRVELSEVESIIRQLDYVSDVSVQTVKHESNYELVAYVVADNNCDEEKLRENVLEYVGESKPPFMVPSYVIKLDEIPLNVNGKVDKRALPDVNRDKLRAKYVAPTNDVEKSIVRVFKLIFDQDDIGILDDFVRLGGDSLTAIKVLSYLEEYNFSTADILRLRTPQAIAASIRNDKEFDLDIYSLKDGCPLNEPQLNVYLDIIANEKVNAYNLPFFMNISNDYSLSDIEEALNVMFDFHPILRMHVNDDFEVPCLVNGRKPSISFLHAIDKDFIRDFLTEPFDLYDSLSRFLIVENEDGYVLFAVFHHLVYDASSKHIFKRDLQTILDGGSIALDVSFLKVAAFNQQIQDTKEFKEAEEFYASRLTDSDDAGILLEDVLGDEQGFLQTTLEMDNDAFNGFLKECNISENIFFTSVFAYTLSRFTGSDKVSFNIIENGRDRFDNFDSIGMYVNTLPILADCKDQNISSFMEQMSDLVYDVMRHNYYPFRLLANQYDIDSDIIFQYLPEWIEYADNNADNLDIENELIPYLDDSVNDFTVDVRKIDESYILNIIYSAKFSKDMCKTFAATYNQILSQMISHNKLSDMDYVSRSDLELLDALNHNEHLLDYDDILDAFNDNLAHHPENNLVSYKDSVYTYSEGTFIADKIAKYLRDYDIKTGDNVSFLVERSELYMFSVLGILSVGATYVPLDDAHPDERIQFILDDTESKVVIVSDDTYERAKSLAKDAILLNISDILKEGIGNLDELPVVYGDVACMLYTSGTTGLPKGVKVTRKSILNIAAVYVDKFDFDSDDVYGLFANISFDAGSWGICQTIYAGACLSIVPDEIKLNVQELNKYFVEHGVTHSMLTTQVGKLFMDGVEDTSLDVLMVGGEKLGDFESPEDYLLIDGFGPTETFAFISSINNNDKIDSSSIGDINYNAKFYVLDNEFRRVPAGAVGELYISGYQVAAGYLNREEENINAFIDNPFDNDEDYSTLYRTGDMVRLLPDRTLAIVGRRDSQVKIRGNRVELSEIEAVIREIDYVEDVTVQTIKLGTNNEIVAYVVVSKEFDSDVLKENISDYVNERKPEYMVPSFVIELDEIPLNVNGKVDKRALPDVDMSSLRVEYVAPTTEAEKLIVHAFEEVFKQDNIGVYDDFTRLGGDSLSAIKVLSYLGDYNVTAADILSLRTPFAIAKSIKENTLDLDIYTLEEGCPLNEPQLNVYLDIIANNKFNIYLIPSIMDIAKDYDIEDILEALDVMLDVHPILGTCISDENEIPCLIKGSRPSIEFKSYAADDYIIKFLTKPFNLYESLSRFLLVEEDEGYSLFAVFHHIIFDALSDGVFKQDLQTILDGGSVEVDDSFLKVSAFSQQIQDTDEYSDASVFYDAMLADVDEVGGLLDSVGGDGPDVVQLDLELDLTQFKSFLSKYEVSENILFTGVFAYTLSRFVGSENVFFNITENGRGRFNNYNAIGMYVNTLPMIVDCKDQNVSDFMEYISDLVYDVMKYNYYPFRLLAKEYGIDSSILFQFMPEWIRDNDADYSEFESMEEDNESENIDELISDLSIDIIQKGRSYSICLQYSDKYSGDVMNRFAESYKAILSQIICVDKLSEINYVSKSDLELLDTYNQTEHALDYEDLLDAFNDNLAKYPDSNLVSYNENVYTYAEGAFIADKLANTLKDLGVENQDCVAFLVERSELYMFSVLGILSAGAVYVPLDDVYPDDCIRFILEDTSSKVVIASDGTYERAKLLTNDSVILNISDILGDDIGTLHSLPIAYNDLACILYTSGTTGIPKGVKITRKSIVNYVDYYINKSGMNHCDVFALYASVSFDVGAVKSICAPFYCGACLAIVPQDIRLDIKKLNEHFIKNGVTHAHLPTQIFKLFINEIKDTSLKILVTGGEKLGEINPSVNYSVVDSYGPTECCVSVTAIGIKDKIDISSIGYLFNNTKAYVLDNENRRVPIGAVGELCISGNQVADGYLNRDEENAKAFIENPFSDEEEYKTLYRTGDLVRLLPDGSLGIVGRRDSQVKIRGNRVELLEIEAVIREMDFIEDLTVQTVKNGTNNELVAYVVVSDEFGGDDLKEYISAYVGERKPEYMVPSFVIELDEIPLNVNGKVDKHALPEVDVKELQVEYVAPTNEIERIIVEAFELVFDQETVSLYDDFNRLGGDSIKSIRLISLLQKEGINCAAKDILDYKTPYAIAQIIEDKVQVSYDAVEGPVDLLPIQSYFFDKVHKNDYTQSFIVKSLVDLDVGILQSAWDELSNLHDMLRVSYSLEDGVPIQEVLPLNTRVCEIREFVVDGDLDQNIAEIHENAVNSLDIYNNRMMDISLVRHGDESYVIFVLHHLIVDGVSWSIILDDLTHIYTKLSSGSEVNLLRPYPYKNWVEDVKGLLDDISVEEREYWMEINNQLDDLDIKGKSRPFIFNIENAVYDVDNILMLSEEEYLALAIARAYKKTYDRDIIFNRESYGREETLADVNRTVGWFTSEYPVIVDVGNEYDYVSLMEDVYKIKKAFNEVKKLGLNYSSLIYTANELEFKHCPVTFNFLSTEFEFRNELFESYTPKISFENEIEFEASDDDYYGIDLNITRENDEYVVSGNCAEGTYIDNALNEFISNIKCELEFIGGYGIEDGIVCCLSESQLGIYLDEKVNDKGIAYTCPGLVECSSDCTVEDMENAILTLIDKHPILKGRIVDNGDLPLIVCDGVPEIEEIFTDDYGSLIKAFNFGECLSYFYINASEKVIFYNLHHIIGDATTDSIIVEDLLAALEGKLDDEVDLGFVYDSTDSFKSKFEPIYESAHEFFNNLFADIDEVNTILDDFDGTSENLSLPVRGIRDRVEEFTFERGITVGALLNSIFAYTYSRFAGSDKVYYTFTEHGRHEEYNKNALGMFVRTIPLLVDCKDDSVESFLSYFSDLNLNAMINSVYPFRLIAKEFDLNNDVGFEYNFDLNDVSHVKDELVVEPVGDLVSDFSCVINDLDDGYLISLEHSDKYSHETGVRFVEAYSEILTQILDAERLSDIEYVSKYDLEILDDINKTEHALVYDDILDAFNNNLSDNPDNALVSYEDDVYSYAEGAFIADKLAKTLKDMDVDEQDCVAFLVERSELYMFCVLGILSAGAVYVPLDDAHPDDRIQFILEDTTAKVLIVSDETYERAGMLVNDEVVLLNISDMMKEDIGTLDTLPVCYGDLACILYTSGTTGIPKGVKITRKSVLNLSEFYIRKYGLGEDDVYALFASIGFDVAMKAIFPTICAGACLSVIPGDIKLDMNAMNEYFINQGVTHTEISTQVAKLFISQVDETSLKVLTTGGEKLGESEIDVDYRFVDSYGPTEACVDVTSIDSDDRIDPSSIGFLLDNIKAYVLDDEFRRVPVGAVGELYLTGNQIADGYLNRDEETVKAFLENPFDEGNDYKVMYRTGDIVRVLPDGSLGIVGRRDSQVKIRGNRVELSEIEAVIREMDFIEDLTVQTVKNGTNNELVAYVVVSDEFDGDNLKEEISAYVDERKPKYMVPSFVVELDEIPLNVNGKVDKRALPEVDVKELQVEYVAPTTETEKRIVEAFERVFNQDNIGIYDDFVRLGGDSLTAIKIISILSKYGISVNAQFIFDNKTPYHIAKFIDEGNDEYGFYLAKEGTADQNMFILPPWDGTSVVFSELVDNLEFEGNVYLIDDFKFDLTIDEIKNTDHNMTFEKYWNAIKDIFQDGDIIAGYSLGCLFAILIVEKLEKEKKIEKCVLIDGTLDFYSDELPDTEEALNIINGLYDLGFDVDKLGSEDHDELIDKMAEIIIVNSIWDFPAAKIEDTPVIYLATEHENEDKLANIARNGEFIFIEDCDHTAIITSDVDKIVKYLK